MRWHSGSSYLEHIGTALLSIDRGRVPPMLLLIHERAEAQGRMVSNTNKQAGIPTSFSDRERAKILDIGCGVNKVPGAIGMDANPRTAADVIHDLDTCPYPFADDDFDQVIGRHVMEHVREPIAVMME